MPRMIVTGLEGIPEVEEGADVAELIYQSLMHADMSLEPGDVLVVTQKIVSKSEGRLVDAPQDPEGRAKIVEQEAAHILRRRDGLLIAETRHGFVCANAGVDSSNVPGDKLCLLPVDPDASARGIRIRLHRLTGVEVGVIISDTFGRAWRIGQTDVAIGVAGILPTVNYAGSKDQQGRTLKVTNIAVADEIAGAAELVMRKADGIPVALVRGSGAIPGRGSAKGLVRPASDDLFR